MALHIVPMCTVGNLIFIVVLVYSNGPRPLKSGRHGHFLNSISDMGIF